MRPTGAEELEQGEPHQVALENARRKAHAAAPATGETVIACDTVVALDGVLYGKPRDEAHARLTLQALAARTHAVISGLVLLGACGSRETTARTDVTFRELSAGSLDWYLGTGEWRGRAGGYAIQGAGAALVRRVEGDYENVVGLPLAALIDLCPQLLSGA